ncbi:MAG TPA: hypothetical protein VGC63_04990 [Solirubrobacterales bacterium]|jgi:translation initiation factor IF-1
METTEIRASLDQLKPGTKIRVKLEDGTEVAGEYGGTEGNQVHIEGADDVAVDKVETFLMDVSTDGPE